MPLNDAGMALAVNALMSGLSYGQLHQGIAGTAGTSNIAVTTRQPITWITMSDGVGTLGNFGLAAPINFTGGTPSGTVYSLTLWSALTGGIFYGEFPAQSGSDLQLNGAGQYSWTMADFIGTAT